MTTIEFTDKIDSVIANEEQSNRANARSERKGYVYCDDQEEEDGLSAASCDDELGTSFSELLKMATNASTEQLAILADKMPYAVDAINERKFSIQKRAVQS